MRFSKFLYQYSELKQYELKLNHDHQLLQYFHQQNITFTLLFKCWSYKSKISKTTKLLTRYSIWCWSVFIFYGFPPTFFGWSFIFPNFTIGQCLTTELAIFCRINYCKFFTIISCNIVYWSAIVSSINFKTFSFT